MVNPLIAAPAKILQILPDRVVFIVDLSEHPTLVNDEDAIKAHLIYFTARYPKCTGIEYEVDGTSLIVVAHGHVNLF